MYTYLYIMYLPCTNGIYCVSKNKHGAGLLTDNVGTDNVHHVRVYILL